MKINVTREDIEEGVPSNGCQCPVAIALQRHGPQLKVGAAFLYSPENQIALKLPDEAISWLLDYDMLLPVQPFSFRLSAEVFMR